ncbi:FRG domain-containing protein [uncultured Clostridium sp.]|uniref:FRG domain-containing protein n=1 Tax=uncultured Clostridium sp. TaxID=59620 RepID=UPI003217EB6D
MGVKFKTHIVTNIYEYIEVVKEIKKGNDIVWYRGQENANFMLIPKIMRNMKVVENQYGELVGPRNVTFSNKGERVVFPNFKQMLEEFKQQAEEHLEVKPKNNFEWLFLAQHYGLPTPLLDWSTDPLIALFFSMPKDNNIQKVNENKEIEMFQNYGYCDGGVAVYAMNPCEYNNKMSMDFRIEGDEPIDVVSEYEMIKGYLHEGNEDLLGPLCIQGTIVDKRLCRQSGNFTVHGRMVWALDYPDVVKEIMHKIFIPYSKVDEIKKYLSVLNITDASIYGGENPKDIIAKGIEDKENRKFYEMIKKQLDKFSISEFRN